MPKRAKAQGVYQRGRYWLDWDKRADGTLRSPALAIFWYDPARGRIRSASTRTDDVDQAKLRLDAHYLDNSAGEARCPSCGQLRSGHGRGFLVSVAIANYQVSIGERRASAEAIRARLAHVVSYLESLPSPAVYCEHIDEAWIERFRTWALARPIVTPKGREKTRSPATVENSVLQLAAAINAAHRRGDITRPPQFRAQPVREVNRTPQHRADVDQLAAMFRWATARVDAKGRKLNPGRRAPLHRFLVISVATLARPDAAHDVALAPRRGQWNSGRCVLHLNPRGRRQTKKYRATVRVPARIGEWLDLVKPKNATDLAFFVPVKSVRSAWDTMAAEIGLPSEGEAGMKLIRRSMAQLLRERKVPDEQVELQLGHRRIDSVSELYAPFKPDYLAAALAAIEGIMGEIAKRVPQAFRHDHMQVGPNVVGISSGSAGHPMRMS